MNSGLQCKKTRIAVRFFVYHGGSCIGTLWTRGGRFVLWGVCCIPFCRGVGLPSLPMAFPHLARGSAGSPSDGLQTGLQWAGKCVGVL